MKKSFLKNLFVKKSNELVEKSLFDKQTCETRKILVKDAIHNRFRQDETIPLEWVLEYNELICKSSPYNSNEKAEPIFNEIKTTKVESIDEAIKLVDEISEENILQKPIVKGRKRKIDAREFNKAFRNVLKLVSEESYNVTDAITKSGLSSGSFYTRMSQSQRSRLKLTMKKSRLKK